MKIDRSEICEKPNMDGGSISSISSQIRALSLTGYNFISLTLGICGVLIIGVSVVLRNNGFAAFGIATLLIAITAAAMPSKIKASGSMQAMIEEAAMNTDRVIMTLLSAASKSLVDHSVRMDEAGKSIDRMAEESLSKTVFLPPKDGVVNAFVPTGSGSKEIDIMEIAPYTSFTIAGDEENASGILVYPVGATVPKIPELKTDDDATSISIEEALDFVLVESTQICSSLNAAEVGDNIVVEMRGVKIATVYQHYQRYLGSIPASLVASVVATIRRKPVSIIDENDTANSKLLRLKVRA